MQNPNDIVAYSIDAAAKASHTGRTKLYAEIKAGRLRAIKLGKRTLVTAEALSEWLNSLPAIGEDA
ncbi:MAG: helix-turn-helix domain-containing protein [Alphaproteobacteria bacterium]|nr:helix-turn-helix domain-containing protein [Alphaproteobacteria bacterium]